MNLNLLKLPIETFKADIESPTFIWSISETSRIKEINLHSTLF